MEEGTKPKENIVFNGEIRPLADDDLEDVKLVLENWLRNMLTGEILADEVSSDLKWMEDSLKGVNDKIFVVAEDKGRVIGVMGLSEPDKRMIPLTQTSSPVELITAYVAREHKGRGVGKALIRNLESKAKEMGHTEIILNSGIRYRRSGWGFYDKVDYDKAGTIENYYDGRWPTQVWRKEI